MLTQEQLDVALEIAAEKGAEKVLEKLGLSDKTAGEDIRNLRNLLKSFKMVKSTFWQTVVKMMTSALMVCLLAGLLVKIKVMGG